MTQLILSFLATFLGAALKAWLDARQASNAGRAAGAQDMANRVNQAADDLEKDYDEIFSRGGYRRDDLLERLRTGSFGARSRR